MRSTRRSLTRILFALVVSFASGGCSSAGGRRTDAGPPPPDGGAPYLTELEISSSASGSGSPLTLVPPFDWDVHDYYVRCGAGTNALTVSIAASAGGDSSLVQPAASPTRPKQTVLVHVKENQAVVAAASKGAGPKTEYWVRCLPHDFPNLQMAPHASAGTPPPGYYLVGNAGIPTGEGAYAMVLDVHGVPVWYYREPSQGIGVYNVDDVVPGAISFIGTLAGLSVAGHPYEIHYVASRSTTRVSVSGNPPDEHELRLLPNGDSLVLWNPTVTGVDLTGLTLPLSGGGTQSFGPNSDIQDCDVREIDPKGAIVWKWSATDHFDPVKDMTYLTPALSGPGGVPIVEPFHCNSIEVDAATGNLLISSRHMDSVFYVEKSTGKVLWKMGGATYTKDGATYVPVADPFYRQHDARFPSGWTSACGGSGQVSVFDDESHESKPARGVVYDVRVGTCGGKAGGATVAWQYEGKSNVVATGSFRVSADGSRVIGWGENGGLVFTEVDEGGDDLLDFYFTDGSSSYRAVKVPLGAFDLSTLRSTAGLAEADPVDAGPDGAR